MVDAGLIIGLVIIAACLFGMAIVGYIWYKKRQGHQGCVFDDP